LVFLPKAEVIRENHASGTKSGTNMFSQKICWNVHLRIIGFGRLRNSGLKIAFLAFLTRLIAMPRTTFLSFICKAFFRFRQLFQGRAWQTKNLSSENHLFYFFYGVTGPFSNESIS
jgi:hypothetical protein